MISLVANCLGRLLCIYCDLEQIHGCASVQVVSLTVSLSARLATHGLLWHQLPPCCPLLHP
jgi:hypothetical protein